MTIDDYLDAAWRRTKISARTPDREPGCDDDRRPGESWATYIITLARHLRTDPDRRNWRPL